MEIYELLKVVGPVGGVAIVIILIFTKAAQKYLSDERVIRKRISDDCHAATDKINQVVERNSEVLGHNNELLRDHKVLVTKTTEVMTEVKALLIKTNGK